MVALPIETRICTKSWALETPATKPTSRSKMSSLSMPVSVKVPP